jgi:hypothetical protein
MLFEKGIGNGNINPRPAITIPKPINRGTPARRAGKLSVAGQTSPAGELL